MPDMPEDVCGGIDSRAVKMCQCLAIRREGPVRLERQTGFNHERPREKIIVLVRFERSRQPIRRYSRKHCLNLGDVKVVFGATLRKVNIPKRNHRNANEQLKTRTGRFGECNHFHVIRYRAGCAAGRNREKTRSQRTGPREWNACGSVLPARLAVCRLQPTPPVYSTGSTRV